MPKHKKESRKSQKVAKETNYGAILLSGFIVFLMVGSIFGYMMYYADSKSDYNYNGFKFVPDTRTNRWLVKLDSKSLEFYNHPTQVENIDIPSNIKETLMDGDALFVTFDPVEGETAAYIDQVRLDFTMALNAIGAISQPSETYTLSVLTCDNVTGKYVDANNQTQTYNRNIIYLKHGNETGITVSGSCVILESPDGQGFIDLRDRLLFDLYGIMGETSE